MASRSVTSAACVGVAACLFGMAGGSETAAVATTTAAAATTTTSGESQRDIFDLTTTCDGADYLASLETRPTSSMGNRKDRAIKSFQQGISLAGKGDWRKAATLFHLTKHLTGDEIASCYHGGALLHARGPDEALRVLLPAVRDLVKSPNPTLSNTAHVGSRVLVADILSSAGRYDEAKEVYYSVLRDKPSSRLGLLGTAKLLTNEQSLLKATDLLEKVINNDPFDVDAHRQLGQIRLKLEKYEDATQHLEYVVRKNPDSASDHFLLSSCLSSHADILDRFQGTSDTTLSARTRARAVGHLQQASWLSPGRCDIQLRLGQELRKQNRLADAANALRQTVLECPAGSKTQSGFSELKRCEAMAELSITLSLDNFKSEALALANMVDSQCSVDALPKSLADTYKKMDRKRPVASVSGGLQKSDVATKVPAGNAAKPLPKKVNKSKTKKKPVGSLNEDMVIGLATSLKSSVRSAILPGSRGSVNVKHPLSAQLPGSTEAHKERPVNPLTCPETSMIDGSASDAEVKHYFTRALSMIMESASSSKKDVKSSSFCTIQNEAVKSEIVRCLEAVAAADHPIHGSYANYLMSHCRKEQGQWASYERHLLISAKTAQPTEQHFGPALYTAAQILLSRKNGQTNTNRALAIDYLNRVSEFAPSQGASELLGRVLVENGDWSGSIDHLRRALRIEASSSSHELKWSLSVRQLLAKSLHFSGAPAAAAVLFEKVIQESKNSTNVNLSAELLVDAGLAYHDIDNLESKQRAAELYQQAIAINKQMGSAYKNLAQLLIEDKQASIAVDFVHDYLGMKIEEFLSKSQTNEQGNGLMLSPQFLELGARALWEAGRLTESQLFYRRLLALSSKDNDKLSLVQFRVSQFFQDAGRFAEAIATLASCKEAPCLEMIAKLEQTASDASDARKQLQDAYDDSEQVEHQYSSSTTLENLDLARLAYELAPDSVRPEIAIPLSKMLHAEAVKKSTDAHNRQIYREEALDVLQNARRNTSTFAASVASLDVELSLATALFESNRTSIEAQRICENLIETMRPVRQNLQGPLHQMLKRSADRTKMESTEVIVELTMSDFYIELSSVLALHGHQLELAYDILFKVMHFKGDPEGVLEVAESATEKAINLSIDSLLIVAEASLDLGKLGIAASRLFDAAERAKPGFDKSDELVSLVGRTGHLLIRNGYRKEALQLIDMNSSSLLLSPKHRITYLELKAHLWGESGNITQVNKAHQLLINEAMIPSLDSITSEGLEIAQNLVIRQTAGLTSVGYVVLGKLLKEKGSFLEAAWCFRAAMSRTMKIPAEAVKQNELADIAFELGSSLLHSQNYSEAINYLLLARSKRPNHAPTHNNLGVAYIHVGRRTEAKRMLKVALRLQDGCLARFNLGVMLLEHTTSHDAAITQFRAAIDMHAKETESEGRGDTIEQSLNHDVDIVEIKIRLAEALQHSGNLPQSLFMLKEAISHLESRSSFLQTQVLLSQLSGNVGKYNTILWRTCNHTLATTLSQMSGVYSKLGQHRESIATMLRARTIWIEDADKAIHLQSLIDLGNAYLHAGNVKAAKAEYLKVIEADGSHLVGLNNMGVVSHRQKEFKAAREFFQRILVLEPQNRKAKEYLKIVERDEKGDEKHNAWTWGEMFGLAPAEL